MMKIEPFLYNRLENELHVLDQTKLPACLEFIKINGCQDGFRVIKDMIVRGAPCIAAVGCLSLVIEMDKLRIDRVNELSLEKLVGWIEEKAELLVSARPTAVNLSSALDRLITLVDDNKLRHNPNELIDLVINSCADAIKAGLKANKCLADFGRNELLQLNRNSNKLTILTHCNTGSLATVGYGTALGVIRSLHESGQLKLVYCTETRPYNQGSRLTAWELIQESIPTTLISDSMVAYLMATHKIDGVIVGADRVVANGDTANKIGTLQIAVTARYYNTPFYVAAPSQSIDLATPDASAIKIEQRPGDELRKYGKSVQLAPDDVEVWNPCFDITPSDLIKGIITELGVYKPSEIEQLLLKAKQTSAGENVLF